MRVLKKIGSTEFLLHCGVIGPLLIGLFGLGLIVAGVFVTDPGKAMSEEASTRITVTDANVG